MVLPRPLLPRVGLLVVLVSARASAQATTLWNFPDGNDADFEESFEVGATVSLSWNGGFNNSISDLWITAFEFSENDPFAQLIRKGVNLSVNGAFAWTVDVPAPQTSTTSSYALKFKPARVDSQFIPSDPELPSPGFLILDDDGGEVGDDGGDAVIPPGLTISPNSTCGGTLTCLSSGFGDCCGPDGVCGFGGDFCGPGCLVGFGDCDTGSTDSISSGGLSVGAQAGIGVGVTLGLIALGVGAWLLSRRYKWSRRPRGLDIGRPELLDGGMGFGVMLRGGGRDSPTLPGKSGFGGVTRLGSSSGLVSNMGAMGQAYSKPSTSESFKMYDVPSTQRYQTGGGGGGGGGGGQKQGPGPVGLRYYGSTRRSELDGGAF